MTWQVGNLLGVLSAQLLDFPSHCIKQRYMIFHS